MSTPVYPAARGRGHLAGRTAETGPDVEDGVRRRRHQGDQQALDGLGTSHVVLVEVLQCFSRHPICRRTSRHESVDSGDQILLGISHVTPGWSGCLFGAYSPWWSAGSRDGAVGAGQFDGCPERRSQRWPVEHGDRWNLITIKRCILTNSNRRPLASRFPALVRLPKESSTLQVDQFGPLCPPVASVGPEGTRLRRLPRRL